MPSRRQNRQKSRGFNRAAFGDLGRVLSRSAATRRGKAYYREASEE